MKRLWSSEPLHTKMPLIFLLIRHTGCMGTNRDLFRRTVLQKCWKVNNCPLDYGSWVEYLKNSNIQTKIVQPFGGFFQQAPANRKKRFYTNRDRIHNNWLGENTIPLPGDKSRLPPENEWPVKKNQLKSLKTRQNETSFSNFSNHLHTNRKHNL